MIRSSASEHSLVVGRRCRDAQTAKKRAKRFLFVRLLMLLRLLAARAWQSSSFALPKSESGAPLRAAFSFHFTLRACFIRGGLNYAQAHRHPFRPHHRRRTDYHRPGVRVRLFRHAGLQGAEGGGLSRHPHQLQPGHHHDRPGVRRPHLHRTHHARVRRKNHRARERGDENV